MTASLGQNAPTTPLFGWIGLVSNLTRETMGSGTPHLTPLSLSTYPPTESAGGRSKERSHYDCPCDRLAVGRLEVEKALMLRGL